MLKRPTVAALFASLGTLAAGHAERALGPTPDAPLIGDLAPADDDVVTVANPILRARVAPDTARALGLDRVRWQLSRSRNSFDTAVVWDSGEVDLGPSIAVTTAGGTFTSADARVGLDDEIRYYWRATFKSSNGAREFPSAIHSFVMRFPVVTWDAFDDPDETPLVAHRPKLSRGLHPATWSPGEGEWRVRSGLLFPVGSAVNRALLPAAANGVISAEVVTPADRSVHGGLHFRFYDRDQHFLVLVSTHAASRHSLSLVRVRLGQLAYVAAATPAIEPNSTYHLQIVFNGGAISVSLNGTPQFTYRDGYLGGQELIGLFGDRRLGSLGFRRLEVRSGDNVPRYEVHARRYRASVRPGNIGELYIRGSSAPDKNVFIDSGVQFGHASAAEIRHDRAAALEPKVQNRVLSQFAYRGRIPVDFDGGPVIGESHGLVSFYADRFVVRDNVKFVDRRDPTIDFDWSSNLAGPSLHYSLAGGPFSRYAPQPSGFIQLNRGAALPHVVQVRLNLGRIAGLSTAIVYNVRGVSASRQARGEPTVDDPAIVVWAKNARDGGTLTFGSGLFPTRPGQEYGFGAVMFVDTTRAGSNVALAARYRDDWTNPAVLGVRRGALRRGTPGDENADGFNESEGYYTVEADARGVVELWVDAGRVRRHRPVFRVYTGDSDARLEVWVNGVPQRDQADFLADRMDPESAVLQLLHDYASTFRLLIRFAPPD